MKGALILGAVFLASITSAQAAIECQAEIIKGRSAHWSYRLIDGRKCWYEGKTQLPKSELYWADTTAPAAAASPPETDAQSTDVPSTNAQSTNAQASPPAVDAFTDPEDGSCCWPPANEADSFESRWRSLGLRPQN